jgi:hypothetical protein
MADLIPSTMTVSGTYFDTPISIGLTVYIPGARHVIFANYGGGAYTERILDYTVPSYYATWTPSSSILTTFFPGQSFVNVVLECITTNDLGSYNYGSTQVGLTLYIPPYTIPVPASTVSVMRNNLNLPEPAKSWPVYVQGMSLVGVVVRTVDITVPYGGSISSVTITVGGNRFDGNFAESPLPNAGTVPISIKVTDNRGNTGTYETSIRVEAYSPPVLTAHEAYRCDSTGAKNENGAYLYVSFTAYAISSCGGHNSVTRHIMYKPTNSDAYMSATVDGDTAILNLGLSTETNYSVVLYIKDAFHESNHAADTITTETITLHMKNGGKAVGIGMYVTNEAEESVHIAWDTHIYGNLQVNELKIGSVTLGEDRLMQLLQLLN